MSQKEVKLDEVIKQITEALPDLKLQSATLNLTVNCQANTPDDLQKMLDILKRNLERKPEKEKKAKKP